jgi:hypothetical protein
MKIKQLRFIATNALFIAFALILTGSSYQSSLEEQLKVLKDEIVKLKIIIDKKDLVVEMKIKKDIETVALELENFQRDTEQSFANAAKGRDDIESDLNSFKRQQRRFIGDLDQRLTTVENRRR